VSGALAAASAPRRHIADMPRFGYGRVSGTIRCSRCVRHCSYVSSCSATGLCPPRFLALACVRTPGVGTTGGRPRASVVGSLCWW
jgi:hypothetical protein